MANGDRIFGNQKQALYHLLDAHTTIGADDGVWVEVGSYFSGLLIVDGLAAGDLMNICFSNAAARPLNSTHGVVMLPVIDEGTPATWVQAVNMLPLWIKIQPTVKAAAAAVTAALFVRNP